MLVGIARVLAALQVKQVKNRVQGRHQVKNVGWTRMASVRSASIYNGDLGAEPPAGSRAEPLVGVPGGKAWQKWGGHVHPSPPRGDAPGRV